MSDEQNINPLDMDLSSAKLPERPLLAGPQTLDLKIEKSEIETGKGDTGQACLLNLELSTTAPAASVTGDTLNAGIRVFHRINYVKVGKLTDEQILEEFITLVQSVGGIPGAKVSNVADWYKQLEGKVTNARVVIEPEGMGKNGKYYPAKNAIKRFNVKK